MYILFEGMPCTGKTSIAKALAKNIDAQYMKSVVSNTLLGDKIKCFRQSSPVTMDYFYLVDGLLDELRVRDLLKSNHVIRDKCHIASLAHLKVQGFASDNTGIQDCITIGYEELSEYSVQPDLIVFLEPNWDKMNEYISQKKDCSQIDLTLLSNPAIYMRQNEAIKGLLRKTFKCELLSIMSFSMDIDQICNFIISKLEKGNEGSFG